MGVYMAKEEEKGKTNESLVTYPQSKEGSRGMTEPIKWDKQKLCQYCKERNVHNVKYMICAECMHTHHLHLPWIRRKRIHLKKWIVNYLFEKAFDIDEEMLIEKIADRVHDCNKCNHCSDWGDDIEWK